MGNNTKRPGFSANIGSGACLPSTSSCLCCDIMIFRDILATSAPVESDDPVDDDEDEITGENMLSGVRGRASTIEDFVGVMFA
mmetsp:Transcript_52990/g.78562  ORF Transcript_52990/g.78562 Transcript_52990/m.78562 type:complete len:83 (+) Transcript_52990:1031-1279(+)